GRHGSVHRLRRRRDYDQQHGPRPRHRLGDVRDARRARQDRVRVRDADRAPRHLHVPRASDARVLATLTRAGAASSGARIAATAIAAIASGNAKTRNVPVIPRPRATSRPAIYGPSTAPSRPTPAAQPIPVTRLVAG